MPRGADPQTNLDESFNNDDLLKVPSGLVIQPLAMQGPPMGMKVPPVSVLPLPPRYVVTANVPNWSK